MKGVSDVLEEDQEGFGITTEDVVLFHAAFPSVTSTSEATFSKGGKIQVMTLEAIERAVEAVEDDEDRRLTRAVYLS